MKRYIKTINGKSEIKTRREITVYRHGTMTINPSEKMILEDGWVEYIEPTEILLSKARESKIQQIEKYDKSKAVNEFFVGGISLWLDKATRAGLLLRFQAEAAQGLVDTSLWSNGVQYPLKVNQAIQMLYAIELYASACYDNTQRHLAAIQALQTIEEIEGYDYTQGYPEKLRF